MTVLPRTPVILESCESVGEIFWVGELRDDDGKYRLVNLMDRAGVRGHCGAHRLRRHPFFFQPADGERSQSAAKLSCEAVSGWGLAGDVAE